MPAEFCGAPTIFHMKPNHVSFLLDLSNHSSLTDEDRHALREIAEDAALSSPELITQKDVAAILGLDRTTIWRATRDGLIPVVELLPGCFRYRRSEIETLVRSGYVQLRKALSPRQQLSSNLRNEPRA